MFFTTTVQEKQEILREISVSGRVTAEVRNKHFKNYGFKEIRSWLQSQGLDCHMAIELESTEVAVITPRGLMMQIRKTDNNQLGFWGGVLENGETPAQGAVRELFEETGMKVDESDLTFVGTDDHKHEYANGDKAVFHAYRYELRLDYIPEFEAGDDDTVGVFYLSHTVLAHQRDWAISLLEEEVSS